MRAHDTDTYIKQVKEKANFAFNSGVTSAECTSFY